MPHNDFVRPDGIWPPEFVLTGGDLRRFDVAQFQALNGDAGGTWVPLKPITIGGHALVLTGGVTLGHTLSGGVLTLSGGRVYLGASIYPSFQAPWSRVINWPLVARSYSLLSLATTLAQPGLSPTALGSVFSAAGLGGMSLPVPPRQLHNGATLARANVAFQIGQKHLVTPAVLPQARLVRSDWAPWLPTQWSATTPFAAGAIMQPTTAYANWPFVYVASGAGGTTNNTEPNWNTAAGINQSLLDGSVTWVATGYTYDAAAWVPARVYPVGTPVSPVPANGLIYVVSSIVGTGTSGATQPVWPLTPGATVTDNPGGNQVVWMCIGTPRAATWLASTAYKQGAIVSASPDNGLYYKKTTAGTGTSGAAPPSPWGTVVGGTTSDGAGSFNWTCIGSNPIGAGSLAAPATADAYFAAGAPQTMSVPCHGATTIDTVNYSYTLIINDEAGVGAFQSAGTSPWAPATTYVVNTTGPGPFVQPSPANGFYYACTVGGTSGGALPTPPPPWPVVIGTVIVETHGSGGIGGTGPSWQCLGSALPSQNLFLSVAFSLSSIVDMRPE